MTPKAPYNPLKVSSKLTPTAIVTSIDLFAQGIGVNRAAKAVGVTRKTMRGLYVELRDRLAGPDFARWHRANTIAPGLVSVDQQTTAKTAFFDLVAACYENEMCHRNFRAGRRKDPQCRACPLEGKFTSAETTNEAISLARSVRDFYAAQNIGAEQDRDAASRFRLRLIHTVTIATVIQSSRRLEAGNLDPAQKDYLSFGTFRRLLIVNLIESPIGSERPPL